MRRDLYEALDLRRLTEKSLRHATRLEHTAAKDSTATVRLRRMSKCPRRQDERATPNQKAARSPQGRRHLVHYAAGSADHAVLHNLAKKRELAALQLTRE
jgi:hypothetical protein